MRIPTHEYVDGPRVTYEGGATFVRVCVTCGRWVKADETIRTNDYGPHPGPNSTCAKCGRTRMVFEGFMS